LIERANISNPTIINLKKSSEFHILPENIIEEADTENADRTVPLSSGLINEVTEN